MTSPSRPGRPRVAVDVGRALALRARGWGWRRIGEALEVSHMTVKRSVTRQMTNPGAPGGGP